MARTYLANDAVSELRDFIKGTARKSCPDNHSLYDDLVQEMALAIIRALDGHTLAYYRSAAICRMKDYMAHEGHHSKECPAVETLPDNNSYEVDWSKIDERLDAEAEPAPKRWNLFLGEH